MISVIIPNYNHALYIAEAIDSVFAQTYSPIEVIVIDNGSTDDSERVLSCYRDSIIYHKQNDNLGASSARNLGVEIASGEYLAFLDADDLWRADKLLLQYQQISQPSGPDMVFSEMQSFYSQELEPALKYRLFCPPNPIQAYTATTLLIRKSSFLKVGFFNTNINTGEFIDWYINAKNANLTVEVVPHTLAFRRIHGGHIGKNIHHQDYCQILKNKILLQRKNVPQSQDC